MGNPDGPPVLFLHGFLSSNLQWELNSERLGADLRTIFVELPGHGTSPTPTTADACTPRAVTEAIEGVRESLDIERWVVVGQSLGGAMGLRYTLAQPSHVSGVAFTNSRAAFGFSRARRPVGSEQRETPKDLRKLPFHPIHAKRFPASLQARMVEAADAVSPKTVEFVTAHSPAWASAGELDQLTCPALLVNGVWESAFQPHVEAARAAIADLTVVDLEGGHSINVEQPVAFDAAIVEFVARVADQP